MKIISGQRKVNEGCGLVEERLSGIRKVTSECAQSPEDIGWDKIFDWDFKNAVYREGSLRNPVVVPHDVPEKRRRELEGERASALKRLTGTDGLRGEAVRRIALAVRKIFGANEEDAWKELALVSSTVKEDPDGQWAYEITSRLAPDYFILISMYDRPLERLTALRAFALSITSVPVETGRLDEVRPLVALRTCIGYRSYDEEQELAPERMKKPFEALTHPLLASQMEDILRHQYNIPLSQRLISLLRDEPQTIVSALEGGASLAAVLEEKTPLINLFRKHEMHEREYWETDWRIHSMRKSGREGSFTTYPTEAKAFILEGVGRPPKVIDFGCGPRMYIPSQIMEQCVDSEVWGLDLPKPHPSENASGVKYVQGSILNIPPEVPDGYFDAAVSSFTLDYLSTDERKKALRNVAQKLAPKATFTLVLHHPEAGLKEIARSKVELAVKHLSEESITKLNDDEVDYWVESGRLFSKVFTTGIFETLDDAVAFYGENTGFRVSQARLLHDEKSEKPIAYGILLEKR